MQHEEQRLRSILGIRDPDLSWDAYAAARAAYRARLAEQSAERRAAATMLSRRDAGAQDRAPEPA